MTCSPLRTWFFGAFELEWHGERLPDLGAAKARSLLAYLILHGGRGRGLRRRCGPQLP